MLAALNPGQTAVAVILAYMAALIVLGLLAQLVLRLTVADYFVASRGLGSFMLLMSLIGTTMTAFALIGSSGEAWESGIVVYGKMASWSGIIHAAIGKKSFSSEALEQNLQAFMDAILRAKPSAAKGQYVKSVTVSSTMGPGVRLDPAGYHV